MKKLLVMLAAILGTAACTSVETATVSGNEIAANGEAIAVIQASSVGLTAIFHLVDIIQSDLDVVTNQLLVSEAKAMGATKVELKQASTTPRHGVFALFGIPVINLIGIPRSSATGVAVK
jgi:hypothetical protein